MVYANVVVANGFPAVSRAEMAKFATPSPVPVIVKVILVAAIDGVLIVQGPSVCVTVDVGSMFSLKVIVTAVVFPTVVLTRGLKVAVGAVTSYVYAALITCVVDVVSITVAAIVIGPSAVHEVSVAWTIVSVTSRVAPAAIIQPVHCTLVRDVTASVKVSEMDVPPLMGVFSAGLAVDKVGVPNAQKQRRPTRTATLNKLL